jgi:hypothetical protein
MKRVAALQEQPASTCELELFQAKPQRTRASRLLDGPTQGLSAESLGRINDYRMLRVAAFSVSRADPISTHCKYVYLKLIYIYIYIYIYEDYASRKAIEGYREHKN